MEPLTEALRECVKKAGGSGVVGPKMFPEKDPKSAQRSLLDALDDDRPAKLSPNQLMLVLRMARAKGYHEGIAFILGELGYAPTTPVEPRDEAADLMRAFQESVALQAELVARMEKAAGRMSLVRSAA